MKYFCAGVLCFLLGAGSAGAETLAPKSKITDVVVFPDRALVTRRAELKLTPGLHEVRIGPLPGLIEKESLTAKGKGAAKVRLFGAHLATVQLEDAQPPRVREIEREIEKLRDEQKALAHRRAVASQKEEFLKSIRAASGEQIGKEIITRQPSADDALKLMTLLDQELPVVYHEMQQTEIQSREIERTVQKLLRELGELNRLNLRSETSVVVDLEALSGGDFVLEVSYRITGATWQPVYEARVDLDSAGVVFETHATVKQRTGEDWKDVKLHLSTAKPSVGGRIPVIEPWYLSKREIYPMPPVAKRQAMMMSEMKPSAQADMMQEAGAVDFAAEIAVASVKSEGAAVIYDLARAETIESNWQPRKVAISSATLPAVFSHAVSPRLSPYAFLEAKIKNETGALLLPGDVQIFTGGAYIGTSSLDVLGIGEEFELSLGIDERVRVDHRQLKAKAEVSLLPGFRGRTKVTDYEYLTVIENYLANKIEVKLTDQIPVSQHDEIKVEQVNLQPKPSEEDPAKPGVRLWKFPLEPGAKKEVRIGYQVKHPVDVTVEGL